MNLPGTDLAKHDIDKLESSYITPDLAKQALLRRVDSAEGAMLMGRNGGADYGGIIFPYLWPGDPAAREYRLRRDHPDLVVQPDGSHKEKSKYLSPPKRSPLLYLVPGNGSPLSLCQSQSLKAKRRLSVSTGWHFIALTSRAFCPLVFPASGTGAARLAKHRGQMVAGRM
jgi:hypothetical protein